MVVAPLPISDAMVESSRAVDDVGAPLFDVTFVVLDLETTGGSPATCEITEVGAVKYRSGERLGSFQTLVNPGVSIPRCITVLTGITDSMLLPAPRIAEVLPALLEFVGGAVLVGHNLRFDTSFLDAALVRHGYPPLSNRRVDTLGLARRLLGADVPNHRLATLAAHFGTLAEPTHRALDDAAATAELLHGLIEGASGFAVTGLDDLLTLPKVRDHPSSAKLALTAALPRRPGVYWFRDRDARVIHVGRSANLRAGVRAYFVGKQRGARLQLLRELATIEYAECGHDLEAAVRELRLIRSHRPRHNPMPHGRVYVRLTLGERFPRIAVVRRRPADGAVFLGPLPSTAWANRVKEAIESVLPLRRCAQRIGATATRCCRCGGDVDVDTYSAVVRQAVAGLSGDAATLLEALTREIDALGAAGRLEEVAWTRDRRTALRAALDRQRRLARLRSTGRVRTLANDAVIEIERGRLVLDGTGTADPVASGDPADADVEEVLLVARWLEREAQTVGSRGRIRVR